MHDYSGFNYGLIRRFAIQLMTALKYLKTLGIIHCDLKPENILLREYSKSGIKIIDLDQVVSRVKPSIHTSSLGIIELQKSH